MLTFDRAHERLSYSGESGEIRWKTNRCSARVGQIAGDHYSNGYRRLSVDCKDYLAHRVVWLMAHGRWPDGEIDHINGDRSDNRLANLRVATSSQNKQNAAAKRTNRSGATGVSWFKTAGKWRADITANKKQVYLGSFDSIEQAAAAYAAAKRSLHPFQPVERKAPCLD